MCMEVVKVSLVGTPIRKFGQVFGVESSDKKFIRVRNSNYIGRTLAARTLWFFGK